VEELPFQGRVTFLITINAALKAPLFHGIIVFLLFWLISLDD